MLSTMNRHQKDLFSSHERMQHCVVYKKVDQCTCYELFVEETNEFLVSCVSCVLLSPMLLFVTAQDCHHRRFEDICCNLSIHYFVAKMTPDWMTGLNYKLTGFDETLICDIKIRSPLLTSAPVSFSIKVKNPDFDPDDHHNADDQSEYETTHVCGPRRPSSSSSSPLSLFSCLLDVNCFDGDDLIGEQRQQQKQQAKGTAETMYTTITSTTQNKPMIELQTRAPTWNSEIKQYTDHYGGRVRIPSRHNFMVLHGEDGEFCRSASGNTLVLEDSSMARMCIRHGKASSNTFILDFRSPATAMTAFAAMCAVHS